MKAFWSGLGWSGGIQVCSVVVRSLGGVLVSSRGAWHQERCLSLGQVLGSRQGAWQLPGKVLGSRRGVCLREVLVSRISACL